MKYKYIKICGITQLKDAKIAIKKNVDFIGMVFHPQSKRLCSVKEAIKIIQKTPFKPKVLVFANNDIKYIENIYQQIIKKNKANSSDVFIQLPSNHLDFDKIKKFISIKKIIPVISVKHSVPKINDLKDYPLIIFDTGGKKDKNGKNLYGGTGETFSWKLLKKIKQPYLIAGGLNPQNIELALQQTNAFGFDVSGGIEKSYGKKDKKKMILFIKKIRNY